MGHLKSSKPDPERRDIAGHFNRGCPLSLLIKLEQTDSDFFQKFGSSEAHTTVRGIVVWVCGISTIVGYLMPNLA